MAAPKTRRRYRGRPRGQLRQFLRVLDSMLKWDVGHLHNKIWSLSQIMGPLDQSALITQFIIIAAEKLAETVNLPA